MATQPDPVADDPFANFFADLAEENDRVENSQPEPVGNQDPEAEEADQTQAEQDTGLPVNTQPATVGGNYTEVYNPETGTYDVVDLDTGEVIASGLTEQEAIIAAQNASVGDPAYARGQEDPFGPVPYRSPAPVTAGQDPSLYPNGLPYDDDGNLNPGWTLDEEGNPVFVGGDFVEPATQALADAARQQALLSNARSQAVQQNQRRQANDGDWRVRLRLAPGSTYLYNDPGLQSDGILYPLSITDGVVFPYMPSISMNYHANYNQYDLVHSNYRGYFYQNSYVSEINLQAVFTAQDTSEANYLLAVIHFFRSATKMFYGQDAAGRGSPPPLVFLQGLGEFQFNLHPCLISTFTYNLPNDVDYIRARSPQSLGTNLLIKRDRQTLPTNPFEAIWQRLTSIGQNRGAINIPPAPNTLGTNSPTYVPTKIEFQISLLPVQSREQVSRQFSFQKFSNGNLLKGGFW